MSVNENSKIDILLVDDRPENLVVMEAVLSCTRYRLVTASSGFEALERLKNQNFAAIILDVQMPEMDGIETAACLRKTLRHAQTPIIFVTAINRDDSEVEHAYETVGALDFIFKPFSIPALRSKVKVLADLYEIQRDTLRGVKQRLNTVIRNAPVIIWALDAAGRVILSEGKGLDKLGYQTGTLIGQSVHELYKHHPDILQLILRALQGETFTTEVELNGIWFETSFAPLSDLHGKNTGTVAVSTDITERKNVQEKQAHLLHEIQENEKRFRVLTEAIPQIVWTSGPTGQVDYANPKWYEYTGKTPEQTLGFTWMQSIHPADLPHAIQRWKEAIQNGTQVSTEYRLQRFDGTYHWFLSRGVPVLSKDGKIARWFGTITDIQAQKETQDRIEQNEHALYEAVQIRDDFMSIASHELKTPLTSLKLQLQLTRRNLHRGQGSPTDPATLSKVLDTSSRQVDRLSHLVEDLLDVSRIRAGKLAFTFENVNISQLALEVVDRFSMQLQNAGLKVKVDAAIPVLADCDRFRMDQVISNLISNAIKYGGNKPIQLAVSQRGEFARISVRDQGMGINKDQQAKIFERFERAVTAQHISGLGLGLFIAREIIAAHGGRILLESELDRGSTFIVEFPLVSALTVPQLRQQS